MLPRADASIGPYSGRDDCSCRGAQCAPAKWEITQSPTGEHCSPLHKLDIAVLQLADASQSVSTCLKCYTGRDVRNETY